MHTETLPATDCAAGVPPPAHPLLERIADGARARGVGPEFARAVLARPSANEVADMLAAVARSADWVRAVGRHAYRHANGFVKVPLAEREGIRVRLHFWPADARGEENIHDHRWDMASRVLLGPLSNEVYALLPPGDAPPGAIRARAYRYRKHRPGLAAEATEQGVRSLRLARLRVLSSGEVYTLRHDVCHRIVKRHHGPAVTLMVQSAPVRAHNRMFRPGPEPPDVCPIPLGPERLQARLDEVAALLSGARNDGSDR